MFHCALATVGVAPGDAQRPDSIKMKVTMNSEVSTNVDSAQAADVVRCLFSELGLTEMVVKGIHGEGYHTPTPIQAAAIPTIMEGRDFLGSAQTGTGKTAAFALPVLHCLMNAGTNSLKRGRLPRVLVLSPTRELATQIAESFRAYGRHTRLRETTIFGGVSQYRQVKTLQQGVDIVVATPGRLCDLMQQRLIDLSGIEFFVIDEADRMFDMGFLPDLKRITAALPTQRQTIFFSATMPSAIEQLSNAVLKDPVRVNLAPKVNTVELIEQSICFVGQSRKFDLLVKFCQDENVQRGVVFTRTKHGADKVADQLIEVEISAEAIHGNKSQGAREKALAKFKMGKARVLVATDVAARGIDVDGITHVFNYDLPDEAESYVHRIGRTGRAGAYGKAISFCDGHERRLLRDIERLTNIQIPVDQERSEQRSDSRESSDRRPGSRGGGYRAGKFGGGYSQQNKFGYKRPDEGQSSERTPRTDRSENFERGERTERSERSGGGARGSFRSETSERPKQAFGRSEPKKLGASGASGKAKPQRTKKYGQRKMAGEQN